MRAQTFLGSRDEVFEEDGAVAAMTEADRVLAERLHAVVTRVAPNLASKT